MDVDGAGPVAERDARGLSRRQLIKASAAAGAAAWTAPLIVESLTSPAAAFSGDCKQYTVKLTASGACFSACFGGVLGTCFPASGSKWGGNCSAPICSNVCGDNPATGPTAGTTTRMPSVASDGDFYKVTYPSNCGPATSLDWQIGGRYGPGDPGTTFIKIAGTTCTGGSGNGCFDPNANASWIRKVNPANSQALKYIYLKYCCSS